MSVALVPRKLETLISTLSLFELFDVLSCSSSPDNGINLGSTSVSLHTSDIILLFELVNHYVVYI